MNVDWLEGGKVERSEGGLVRRWESGKVRRWESSKVGRVQGTGRLKITDGVGAKVRGVGDLAGGQEASSTGLGRNARQ